MIKYDIGSLSSRTTGSAPLPIIRESPGVERSYLAVLRKMLSELNKAIARDIVPLAQAELAKSTITQDIDAGSFDGVNGLSQALVRTASTLVSNILDLGAQKHTATFMATAQRALGINLSAVISGSDLTGYLEAASLRNAGLIKNLSDVVINRVQQTVLQSVLTGGTVRELKKKIAADFGFGDSRAKLIARDQTAKLNSDLNRIRHTQAGVDDYEWLTSEDERVRPRHRALNGKHYKYGEPTGAEDGLPPGQPIQCRCVARGIVYFGSGADRVRAQGNELVAAPVTPAALASPPVAIPAPVPVAPTPAAPAGPTVEQLTLAKLKAEKAAEIEKAKKIWAEFAAKKAAAEVAKVAKAQEKILETKTLMAKTAKQGVSKKAFKPTKKDYMQVGKNFEKVIDYDNALGFNSYVGNGYKSINKTLRAGDTSDMIEKMKVAIDKSVVPIDMEVFRGVGQISDMVPGMKDVSKLLGAEIEDKAFVSVAQNARISETFAFSNNKKPPPPALMTTIRLRKGQKALHNGANGLLTKETELIMQAGTRFRVVEVNPDGWISQYGKRMDHIVLEVIE